MPHRGDSDLHVSLPYRERAALAILSGSKDAYSSVTIYEPNTIKPRQTLDAEWGRHVKVSWAADISRRVVDKAAPRRHRLLGMHLSKVIFDAAVAANCSKSSRVVLGFPGATREIFRKADEALKILHQVDAHPKAHNDRLLSHGTRDQMQAELYPSWLVDRICEEIHLSDVVLVPSRIVRDQMMSHGVPEKKIAVQPYGVDHDLFQTPSAHIPAMTSTMPTVAYVGQMSRRKGIRELMAAAKNADVQIELIGNAFDRELVRNLPDNVRWHSHVSHDELSARLRTYDAFVIPTLEDACSLVALEAASAGLPVITTTENGANECLSPDSLTIVHPGDVRSLALALNQVEPLSDETRSRNRENARLHIRTWATYSTDVIAEIESRVVA